MDWWGTVHDASWFRCIFRGFELPWWKGACESRVSACCYQRPFLHGSLHQKDYRIQCSIDGCAQADHYMAYYRGDGTSHEGDEEGIDRSHYIDGEDNIVNTSNADHTREEVHKWDADGTGLHMGLGEGKGEGDESNPIGYSSWYGP